ncbi:MAG TPA: (Fe-S)-binding protein [Acidimicrobiia bacterium]|nr:(Fe-S)-binding protein [Acidimicrobiia bacterium]
MGWVTEHHPTTAELNACVQCGLCLPVCPTFRLTGRETASPRGRLHAMSAVAQGIVEVDESFASIIDFCLGCRACEPVCPGLVPYGRALEGTRAEIDAQIPGRSSRHRWAVGTALGSRALMRLGGIALSVAQALGLTGLAPRKYRRVSNGLRRLKGRPRSSIGHAGGTGDSGTVGLLAGCIQDEWFRPVNQAAIVLLEMAGFTVVVPERQTCCGALAAHDGKADAAKRFQTRNTDAFGGYDYVVATAAGCSAHLADYRWMGHEPETLDVTVAVAQAIEDGRLPRVSASNGPIAIQDPCHLRHAQRVVAEPRAILAAAGYDVVEIDEAGLCCGAAGLYTMLQPEASDRLGSQKADQVRSTGVSRVASANPGCEMQLRSHLEATYDIKHPIEWYFEALTIPGIG